MTYVLPAELQQAVTATKRKSVKGAIAEIAGDTPESNKAVPLPERELITIPVKARKRGADVVNEWELTAKVDPKVMAMLARRERNRQTTDHHNLGLVPADGDDVAQLAVELAQAISATRSMLKHGVDDLWDTIRIARLNLWGDSSEELQAELEELAKDRWAFDGKRLRKVSYKRSTKQAEQAIADKFSEAQRGEFIEKMTACTEFTYGELLLALKMAHNHLNRQAMATVRGMNQFGRWLDADTSELSAQLDTAGNIFDVHEVDETKEERRRAILAHALGTNYKKPEGLGEALMLLADLAGYKYSGLAKSGDAKLKSKERGATLPEIEAEHGRAEITLRKKQLTQWAEAKAKLEKQKTRVSFTQLYTPVIADKVVGPKFTRPSARKARIEFDKYINTLRADGNTVALKERLVA